MSRASTSASYPAPSTSLEASKVVQVETDVFKDTCLPLFDQVHDHDIEVVVTRRGEAVARVVAPDSHLPSAFGFLRGTLLAQGDLVASDFEAWGDLG